MRKDGKKKRNNLLKSKLFYFSSLKSGVKHKAMELKVHFPSPYEDDTDIKQFFALMRIALKSAEKTYEQAIKGLTVSIYTVLLTLSLFPKVSLQKA